MTTLYPYINEVCHFTPKDTIDFSSLVTNETEKHIVYITKLKKHENQRV